MPPAISTPARTIANPRNTTHLEHHSASRQGAGGNLRRGDRGFPSVLPEYDPEHARPLLPVIAATPARRHFPAVCVITRAAATTRKFPAACAIMSSQPPASYPTAPETTRPSQQPAPPAKQPSGKPEADSPPLPRNQPKSRNNREDRGRSHVARFADGRRHKGETHGRGLSMAVVYFDPLLTFTQTRRILRAWMRQ